MRRQPPKIDNAPGLCWRPRAEGYAAVWIARADLVRKGFRPRTQRLWPPSEGQHGPIPEGPEVDYIQAQCLRLQDEMLGFAHGGGNERGPFEPTISGLIRAYQDDPDSPFNRKIRFESRQSYLSHMKAIGGDVGPRALAGVRGRDFQRWYDNWAEAGAHVPRAHARMTMVRQLVSFGVAILEDPECIRLSALLDEQTFSKGRPRLEEINAEQAIAIRRRAHEIGRHSIALGQSMQFETALRPRDVIGLWTPRDQPGVSDIIDGPHKWLYGIDWRATSPDLILTHRLSKSIHGRDAIMNPRAGKVKQFNLKLYPMVMEDLAYIPVEARTGPIIIDEDTGKPYDKDKYRRLWRKIATEVGVPAHVQNRDSRAGAATEAIEAMDGDLEAARHALGHSDIRTTQIYSRAGDRQTAKVAEFRAKKRNEPQ